MESNMNLLFLVDNPYPTGGLYSIFRFAEELNLLNHKCFVVTTREPNDYELIKPYKFILKVIPSLGGNIKGKFFKDLLITKINEAEIIKNIFQENKIDWIFGVQLGPGIRAMIIARKYNIKLANFVFEYPDHIIKSLSMNLLSKIKLKLRWGLFKKSIINSNLIIANSQYTANGIANWSNLSKEKIIVAYPAIVKNNLKIKSVEKKNQVIFIGSVVEDKGIDIVIRALGHLEYPPKFVVCGVIRSGKEYYRLELEGLAKQNGVDLIITGRISEEQKWHHLYESKLFVGAPKLEGFFIPAAEALSAGIQCLLPDLPILRDVYGEHIYYYKSGDIIDFASKLDWLLKNEDVIVGNILEHKEFAENNFSWSNSAKIINNALNA